MTETISPPESRAARRRLSAAERHLLLVEWCDTERSFPEPLPVHDLVARQARRAPAALAVADGRRQVTYGELEERANGLAWQLRALGVGPEVTVALVGVRSVEMIAGALAVLKAGGCYLPLASDLPAGRLRFMVEDSQAAVLLAPPRLATRLPAGALQVLPLALAAMPRAAAPPPGPTPAASLAYTIYTSGSTGRPKGVEVEHASLARLVRWHQQAFAGSPADRMTQFAGPGFDVSVWEIWSCLASGGSLHIPDDETRSSAPRMIAWLAEQRITFAFLSTHLLELTLAEPWPAGMALRILSTAGDRLRRWPPGSLPCPLHNLYGPTEATVYATGCALAPGAAGEGLPPIGRPLANSRIYLLDEALQPVRPGAPGELWIGGGGLARGYRGRPELTAEAFAPDPFAGAASAAGARMYRTGDLARHRSDGNIDFLGRVDFQIKIRGFRIEPGEIEAELLAHPAVRETVVLARDGEAAGPRLVAYVVPAGPAPERAELRGFLDAKLPDYMVPSSFILLPALPLTPNGKIDRRALEKLADSAAASAEEAAYAAPRTLVEQTLAEIWAELFGLRRVGIRDPFVELGGHSLLGTRVLARIERRFGVKLGLSTLLAAATVEGLAREVEIARAAGARPGPEGGPTLAPVPRDRELPLSFAQQRLWFLDRLQPGSALYNLPAAWRLRGRLAPGALAASLVAIVGRHEALRTRFSEGAHGPRQLVDAAPGSVLRQVDLSGLPPVPRRREQERLRAAAATAAFDLGRGPLLRALLLRLDAANWEFGLCLHHIVADGWSMGVLQAEIEALYGGLAGALRPQLTVLPDLPVQYADYAVWQRRCLSAEVLERQLAYWRARLADHPPALELPADRPRPAVRTSRGAAVPLALGAELTATLRAFSRQRAELLFVTVLAGFLALLHRYTGEVDLLVGTPSAGRKRVEIEGLIGFFVNTLVLRTEVAGDPAFAELLGRVREAALAADAHDDLPFERIVEELAPERSLSQSPLFQVAFALQTAPGAPPRLPGVEVETLRVPSTTAKFDLTFELAETADGLAGEIEYSCDLFDAATAERMADHFCRLLAGAAANPDAPLSALPLLAAAERRQLVAEWNQTGRDYPRDRSLHGLFAEQARRTPEAPAVIAEGESLTYGELAARAGALAARLRRAGVGAADLVALAVERSPAMVVGALAILSTGAAYVPLDPTHPRERLAFLLADTHAAAVLTERRLASTLPAGSAPVVLIDEMEAGAADAAPSPAGGDCLAYVIYTSGSTGRPKGVAVAHRAVLRLVANPGYLTLAPGDRVAQAASASFDATVFELWAPLLHGAAVVILPREVVLSPAALAAALRRHRIGAMFLTTALFHQVAREDPAAFAPLDALLFGGEAADPAAVRAVLAGGPPRRLLHVYGPTEACVFSTWCEVRGVPPAALTVPIGQAIVNSRAHVLDGTLRPVPVGVRGSLYLGGEGLARGYLNRPELTAERFVPDPFAGEAGEPGGRLYATGDLVRRLPGGDLEFLGRADQQVKIRGFRIEPGEIEAVLASHPRVREAVVLVRDEGALGKRLVACLVAAAGSDSLPLDPALTEEVRERAAAALPDYMVPAAFVWLPALPLTASGKLDRRALAELPQVRQGIAAPAAAPGHAEPRTPVEQVLAQIWAELLGCDPVGIRDDFFQLGGHSLLVTQVLSRVRRLLGVELSVRTVFESPTVEALARQVELARRTAEGVAGLALMPVPRDRELPLSFAQQRLWFLDRLQPGSALYNLPFAWRLRGRLAPAALAAALGEIVRRHEALRTRFVEGAEGPVQAIDPPSPFALPRVDLRGLPAPAARRQEERLALAEAGQPFDLARGPLLRAMLVQVAPEEWVLVLTMHHIISDGWSMAVFNREIEALYGALAGAHSAQDGAAAAPAELAASAASALSAPTTPGGGLPELPVQYADYAVWQRRWLTGELLERQLAYWRERLAGLPPFLELPTDRPRPAVRTLRGATVPLALGAAPSRQLQEVGRQQGAPLFMTTLAAFLALLHRYTGQTDLPVGTPLAGRGRVKLEGLIGFFVNTLVLRGDAAGDPTFAELLGRTRETALGAYVHGDLPFDRLVEELAPERHLAHTPLFQIMFVLQIGPHTAPPRLAGLASEELAVSSTTAKFDLTVVLADTEAGLAGTLEYDRDLFDAATAERMADHFGRLLAGAAADPGARLSTLPLLAAAERRQLIVEWNQTGRDYPRDQSLHGLFAEQARRTPEASAVIAEGESLTYGELAARAAALAARLRAAGVGAEDLVALAVERSPAMVVGALAILATGAAYVPLDPAHPRERLAFLLADTGAAALLTERRLTGALPAGSTPVLAIDEMGAGAADAGSGAVAASAAGTVDGAAALDGASSLAGGDRLAYVIYTSGSTGRPKGVAVAHRAVLRLVANADYLTLAPGDRVAQTASASFDAAVFELWATLLHGAALVILPREVVLTPSALAAAIRRHRIGAMVLTTSLFHQVAREEPAAFAPLDALLVGGEAIDPAAVRAVLAGGPPRRLLNGYGPTEASVISTWYEVRDVPPGALTVPIGQAIVNSRAHVLDAALQPVPVGVRGSLYVGGEGLARGYLHRPELTAERFVPDPFAGEAGEPGGRLYATGDLVRRLPGGDLEFLGRADQQVKIRGFRIELGEIEAVLAGHPRVREAVVLVRDEGALGKRLVACLVPAAWPGDPSPAGQLAAPPGSATPGSLPPAPASPGLLPSGSSLSDSAPTEEVRAHAAAALPDYMVPAAFVWLPALPLTASGKLDRRALAELPQVLQSAAAPAAGPGFVAPRTRTEETIAGIFCQLFGLPEVGACDNFFALGGHSLLATQVAARVRRYLGVELAIRTLFEQPTVAGLALQADAQLSAAAPPGIAATAAPPGFAAAPPPLRALPRDPSEPLPLSFAQQRLWFLDQLEPDSPLYSVPAAFRMAGPLDLAALAGALAEIVRRHEALRTRFPKAGGEPMQVIAPPAPARFFSLPLINLATLPEAARTPESGRLARQQVRLPFDLARGPLARFAVARLNASEHVFFLALHHIVSDGWSLGVLIRELSALYGGLAAGTPPRLPPLPVQYADYAVWQREWLRGEALERELAYWRGRLGDAPAVLDLPSDRPRPAVQSYRGGLVPWPLPAALAARLDAAARELGGTRFILLMAAFQALLGRISGATEINVGMPIAGRTRVELEGLIGFFVNTLVLRASLAGSPTFAELVGRVRDVALAAHAHQDLPFEKLVEMLEPERSLSHSPLFQVMLMLHNDPLVFSLPGLRLTPIAAHGGTSKFDLVLAMYDEGRGLEGSLEYNSDLFDRATAARLLAELETLLAGALADAGRPLSELPLVGAAERAQLIVEWNDSASAYPRAESVATLFAAQAARTPAAIAVVCGAASLTYAELAARAHRLANHLRLLGVGPGARVALAVERSLELVPAILGTLASGAAYVPLDPAYPAERLAWMLGDCQANLLLTQEHLLPRLPAAGLLTVVLPRDGARGGGDGGGGAEAIARQPATAPEPAPGGDDLAYVMYTSGSTGWPKGVAVTHRNVVRLVLGNGYARFAADETCLLVAPISFDASTFELWGALLHGSRLVLFPPEGPSPAAVAEVIARHGVTTAWMTTAFFHEMVETDPRALAPLRQLLTGGEVISPMHARDALAAAPGLTLIACYGPTEGTTFTTCHPMRRPEDVGATVALGRPIANARVYVADPMLQPLPPGVPGELLIGGDGLAIGYLGRPDLTAERFVPDPFGAAHDGWSGQGGQGGGRLYRTGDRVRWTAGGSLDFLGRLDRQVKLRGFRIEPGEIEAVLAEHPAVRQAAVDAREIAGGKRLVAWFVPADAAAAPAEPELKAWLSDRLPGYMVPAHFVRLDALPLGASGKVDRRALAATPAEDLFAGRPAFVAPRTPLEEMVAAIWAEVLGAERVGIDDNFWDLGGHSLLATKVLARVNERLDLELPLQALFKAPTIVSFTAALGESLLDLGALPPADDGPGPQPPAAGRQGAAQPERVQ